MTRESLSSPSAQSIPLFLRRAFRTATSNLPGPVYRGIPADQLTEEIDSEPLAPERYRAEAPGDAGAASDRLRDVLGLVAEAKAPVILAGRELKWDHLDAELLDLAEKLDLPVLTTLEGHGGVSTHHPRVLGATGRAGWPVANECLRNADVILALGVKFDLHGTGFDHALVPKAAKLVHVSRFPEFIGSTFPPHLGWVSSLRSFLSGLSRLATENPLPVRDISPWVDRLTAWRDAKKAEVEGLRHSSPIKPQWVASALSPHAVPGSFFAIDGGNFKRFIGKYTDFQGGGLLFKDDGFGCVGSSFPIALGYKAARPDAKVFCLTGDMGYLVNGGELETAVREHLPVVTIIFNDQGLGNIREYQVRNHGARHIGVDYAPVDYAAAARAFGAHGERVTDPREVEPAIQRAVDSGVPAVVDIVVDKGALAPK